MPKQKIGPQATDVHKLMVKDQQMFRIGHEPNGGITYTKVSAISLQEAILDFYKFLVSVGQKSILTAHNATFDRPRIMKAIQKTSMMQHFVWFC